MARREPTRALPLPFCGPPLRPVPLTSAWEQCVRNEQHRAHGRHTYAVLALGGSLPPLGQLPNHHTLDQVHPHRAAREDRLAQINRGSGRGRTRQRDQRLLHVLRFELIRGGGYMALHCKR